MTLREVTRSIISLVENVSGCPVVVSEDGSAENFKIDVAFIVQGRLSDAR